MPQDNKYQESSISEYSLHSEEEKVFRIFITIASKFPENAEEDMDMLNILYYGPNSHEDVEFYTNQEYVFDTIADREQAVDMFALSFIFTTKLDSILILDDAGNILLKILNGEKYILDEQRV